MFAKELKPGQSFTTAQSHGEVYKAVSVRTGGGYTTITYLNDLDMLNEFYTRPLSTVTVVG